MTEPKINPCPFCGHTAPYLGGDIHRAYVVCARNTCCAQGPERKSDRGAIEAWNRRKETSR